MELVFDRHVRLGRSGRAQIEIGLFVERRQPEVPRLVGAQVALRDRIDPRQDRRGAQPVDDFVLGPDRAPVRARLRDDELG